ncbi:Ig-like domain-containing protein [Methanobacterium paludis]|uniref:SbsA Ig-like domain-containing protein n=1 Tax=Methanobacterium paludis (strain DSM 25820 / JCM 18151 / SWAN1) TaxID=868131 RepID=F6D738_METPW|nr:Ig-like domain-containing protein [Methanobacterium paludis]AEG18405.1 hypothetical protein MSWAN_1391 [Methanobacterium paludis]
MIFLLFGVSILSLSCVSATGLNTTVTPHVTAVNPSNNAVNVGVDKVINVTFSEPIKAGSNWIEVTNSNGKAIPITTSINGSTLTITPTNNLTKATKYTVLIHTGSITDMDNNSVSPYVSRFTTDSTVPTVKTADPANSAVNIAITKVIKITFSEAIKTGNNWIEVTNSNGKAIPITTSINGSTLTITPTNNLTKATKYTVLIHTGSITDLAGNNVAGYVTRFTTDGTAPTVKTADPKNSATNIAITKVITVTFSEPIKAGTSWIEVTNSNGKAIPITTSINGSTLTITPTNNLTKATKYTVLIHTGSITDLAGNNVAGYVTRFTTDGTAPTVKSSNPANSATNIAITKVITVTFSEAIKAGTSWIELISSNGTSIDIKISISGNTLTITPTSNLTNATPYTVLIHTGSITDLAGNNVAGYVTRFTTYMNSWCRPVYIISDNIINTTTDNARINQIIDGLATLGVYAENCGLGPNKHIEVLESAQVPQNALVVDICGGACAGTIYEMNTTWYKGIKGSRKVFTVFWAPTSVDITGLAWLVRAHDDDFDPASFTGLAHPDQYMLSNGYNYIYSGDMNAIINSIYNESKI